MRSWFVSARKHHGNGDMMKQHHSDFVENWKCPKCGLEIAQVILPVNCSCGFVDDIGMTKGSEKPSFSTCKHRGESTGEMVACGCPSGQKQMVYWCDLYATTCARNTSTRGSHRSCLTCFASGEGWEPK